tara:strand:+ start:174 stop:1256 length:1083 start_codon:yes stop_codon:yes gene_type:complete
MNRDACDDIACTVAITLDGKLAVLDESNTAITTLAQSKYSMNCTQVYADNSGTTWVVFGTPESEEMYKVGPQVTIHFQVPVGTRYKYIMAASYKDNGVFAYQNQTHGPEGDVVLCSYCGPDSFLYTKIKKKPISMCAGENFLHFVDEDHILWWSSSEWYRTFKYDQYGAQKINLYNEIASGGFGSFAIREDGLVQRVLHEKRTGFVSHVYTSLQLRKCNNIVVGETFAAVLCENRIYYTVDNKNDTWHEYFNHAVFKKIAAARHHLVALDDQGQLHQLANITDTTRQNPPSSLVSVTNTGTINNVKLQKPPRSLVSVANKGTFYFPEYRNRKPHPTTMDDSSVEFRFRMWLRNDYDVTQV